MLLWCSPNYDGAHPSNDSDDGYSDSGMGPGTSDEEHTRLPCDCVRPDIRVGLSLKSPCASAPHSTGWECGR